MMRSIQVTVTMAMALCGAAVAHAQAFPTRPVRIVIPFAPGGGTDNLTRIMAPKLT